MEDLFPILMVIFFLVAPLIEKVLKAGRRGQDAEPPPQRRPQPRSYQQRSETLEEDAAEQGSAADMLPDDLWAILTGETRPPRPLPPEERPASAPPPRTAPPEERPAPSRQPQRPAPRPRAERRPLPVPRPLPPRPAPATAPRAEDEAAADEELVAYRPPPAPERFERVEYAPQDYVRDIPRHEPPVIVSMETPLESDEVRHGRFHDRMSRLAGPELVQRGPARQHVGLHTPAELRRAIILTEVLGPPKGLE